MTVAWKIANLLRKRVERVKGIEPLFMSQVPSEFALGARRQASAQHDAIPGPDGGTSGEGFLGAVEAGQSIKSTNEK